MDGKKASEEELHHLDNEGHKWATDRRLHLEALPIEPAYLSGCAAASF
jgi:hypothetical protein